MPNYFVYNDSTVRVNYSLAHNTIVFSVSIQNIENYKWDFKWLWDSRYTLNLNAGVI